MTPKASENSEPFPTTGEIKNSQPKFEILYEGFLYDVSSFIPRHPGGNIIRFYTEPGEDATLAIQQFHHRSMDRIVKVMKTFPKRIATDKSQETLDKRNVEMTKDFQALHKELVDKGYYKPSYIHVFLRFLEVILICFLGLYLCTSPSLMVRIIGAVVTGIGGGRSGWIMHEGGHHSLSGSPRIDRVLQSFAMGQGAGFSAAWWRSQHNRHHAMPQRLQHDVDLETLPLIAFNRKVIKNPQRDVNFFVRNQAKLFMLFDGVLVFMIWRFWLCPRYAIKKGAYLDLFFMCSHLIMFFSWGTIPLYILVSFVGGNYMLLNFALSHTHLPVAEEPRHWIEYCLSHTVDIEPSWWCDWLMGYLNYQIEHHLFPTMPQFRQREIKEKVKALAEKHGLPYVTMTYWEAVKKTFANLQEVEDFADKVKSL